MNIKRMTSAIIAAVMALALALPVLALGGMEPKHVTPEGYNDHDYQRIVAFLDTEDENGVTNAEKLRQHYSYYEMTFDYSDPSTWGYIMYDFPEDDDIFYFGFIWTDEPEKQLRGVSLHVDGDVIPLIKGTIDVSGCQALRRFGVINLELDSINASDCPALVYFTSMNSAHDSINVTGCPALIELNVDYNGITELDFADSVNLERLECAGENIQELDISNCTHLTRINVGGSPINSLDVSGCTELETLWCGDTNLTELAVAGLSSLSFLDCMNCNIDVLDLTGCTALSNLLCRGTRLTRLDLSDCPELPFDLIETVGSGTIGYYRYYHNDTNLYAVPDEGVEFLGWSDDHGVFSENPHVTQNDTDSDHVCASFGFNIIFPGDANCDGTVGIDDALFTLRVGIGLTALPDGLLNVLDVNEDGEVTLTDALTILRMAMGLAG